MEIKISNFYLAFNYSEIIKYGIKCAEDKLNNVRKDLSYQKINFEWRFLYNEKGGIVHSKGYAIFQKSKDDEIMGGFTIITSANFTNNGFFGNNIELGHISETKKDLIDFKRTYDYLWNNFHKSSKEDLYHDNLIYFYFHLFSSGVFMYKWTGSLKQDIGIKYRISEKEKNATNISPLLKEYGFETGETLTRQVFDLTALPDGYIPDSFTKNFAIDTYFGKWCPRSIWDELNTNKESHKNFIDYFIELTNEENLTKIRAEAEVIQELLIENNLILPPEPDHLDKWEAKILSLRDNRKKLLRYYFKYEINDFPLSIEQDSEIQDLYDNLNESISISKRKNFVMTRVLEVIKKKNLSSLKLSNDERKKIALKLASNISQ